METILGYSDGVCSLLALASLWWCAGQEITYADPSEATKLVSEYHKFAQSFELKLMHAVCHIQLFLPFLRV